MNTCHVTDSHLYTMTLDLPRPVAPKEHLLQHKANTNKKINEPFVMRDKLDNVFYWFPSGLVMKYDVNYKTKYTWHAPPTIKSVLEQSTHTTDSYFRFYSDGRITWRMETDNEESHWSPDPVGAVPVEGVVEEAIHNCLDCLHEDNPYRCIGPTCDNYYTKKQYEAAFDECDDYDGYEENDENDIECPACRGPYDGYDYGGSGCSRECAYGDFKDRFYH